MFPTNCGLSSNRWSWSCRNPQWGRHDWQFHSCRCRRQKCLTWNEYQNIKSIKLMTIQIKKSILLVEGEIRIGNDRHGDGTLLHCRQYGCFIFSQKRVSWNFANRWSNVLDKTAIADLSNPRNSWMSRRTYSYILVNSMRYRCLIRICGIARLSTWKTICNSSIIHFICSFDRRITIPIAMR